jgi:hypothetical protein
MPQRAAERVAFNFFMQVVDQAVVFILGTFLSDPTVLASVYHIGCHRGSNAMAGALLGLKFIGDAWIGSQGCGGAEKWNGNLLRVKSISG